MKIELRSNAPCLIRDISDGSSTETPSKGSRCIDDEASEAFTFTEQTVYGKAEFYAPHSDSASRTSCPAAEFDGLLVGLAVWAQRMGELELPVQYSSERLPLFKFTADSRKDGFRGADLSVPFRE